MSVQFISKQTQLKRSLDSTGVETRFGPLGMCEATPTCYKIKTRPCAKPRPRFSVCPQTNLHIAMESQTVQNHVETYNMFYVLFVLFVYCNGFKSFMLGVLIFIYLNIK